jgi:hypothetical protein
VTSNLLRCGVFSAVIWLAAATTASAQIFETIGIRAQGMAGAFVALADDSTATWWNPAGIASGAYFSGIVERGYIRPPNDDKTLGISFALPSLGLSYYRLSVSERVETDSPRFVDGRLPTTSLNILGATFGQSLSSHFVLASTVKLVLADDISPDVDLGLMARFGALRAGFVLRHLHEPDVIANGNRLAVFDRQARAGAAYVPEKQGVSLRAAVDGDLTTTFTAYGRSRHLAGGGELWFQQSLGLRGGMSVNTIDDRRRSLSAGASIAVRKGLFVDGQLTRGDDILTKGWGVAFRVTY